METKQTGSYEVTVQHVVLETSEIAALVRKVQGLRAERGLAPLPAEAIIQEAADYGDTEPFILSGLRERMAILAAESAS